jgi:hypothetical protein
VRELSLGICSLGGVRELSRTTAYCAKGGWLTILQFSTPFRFLSSLLMWLPQAVVSSSEDLAECLPALDNAIYHGTDPACYQVTRSLIEKEHITKVMGFHHIRWWLGLDSGDCATQFCMCVCVCVYLWTESGQYAGERLHASANTFKQAVHYFTQHPSTSCRTDEFFCRPTMYTCLGVFHPT